MECQLSGNVVHVCTSYHKAARKIISCKNYCNSAIKCVVFTNYWTSVTMNNQNDYSHEVKMRNWFYADMVVVCSISYRFLNFFFYDFFIGWF